MADYAKLQTICGKTYKEQAVWFLNCFWEEFASKEAELLWQYVLKNEELDLEFHKEGTGLDEMKVHVFLEKFDETLTVRDMRDKLRSTGAIAQNERPKSVPLIHYLLYKYNANWHTLVDEGRQGSNKEEMEKAEKLLAEVQSAFQQSEAKASVARKALLEAQQAESSAKSREAEAKQREAEAKASEEQAKQREAVAKASAEEAKQREVQAQKDAEAAKVAELDAQAAQRELEAALAEVHAQEQAYNAKKADLEKKSEEGGVVSRNKAKAELAQHLAEDPLPLRKAKITQEAAVKRAERTTQAAAEARKAAEASSAASSKARAQAEEDSRQASKARQAAEADAQAASNARQSASQAREAAEAAARASAKAKEEADQAVEAARQRLQEAEDYLAEAKSKPGQAFGGLWWIDRELHEQKKYLPVSKGGIAK